MFPELEDLEHTLSNVDELGKTLKVPAAAVRLDAKDDYEPKLQYYDDGSIISFMTAMDIDRKSGKAVLTGPFQYRGFAICDVDN